MRSLDKVCVQFALDDYGVIKCINFIRRAVADGTDPLPQVQAGPDAFKDDQYLQPVRGDDALLFHDFSQDEETKNEAAVSAHAEQELEQLRADNEALRQALQQLRVDVRLPAMRGRVVCMAAMRKLWQAFPSFLKHSANGWKLPAAIDPSLHADATRRAAREPR